MQSYFITILYNCSCYCIINNKNNNIIYYYDNTVLEMIKGLIEFFIQNINNKQIEIWFSKIKTSFDWVIIANEVWYNLWCYDVYFLTC